MTTPANTALLLEHIKELNADVREMRREQASFRVHVDSRFDALHKRVSDHINDHDAHPRGPAPDAGEPPRSNGLLAFWQQNRILIIAVAIGLKLLGLEAAEVTDIIR